MHSFLLTMQATQADPPLTVTVGPSGATVTNAAVASATAAWRAADAARDELRLQLEALKSERHGYLREIEDHGDVGGQAASGMHQRIAQLDVRIAELDMAIAAADAEVARTAAVPGAVVMPPRVISGPPEAMFFIGPMLMFAVMLPISIAFARRIWRKSTSTVQQFPGELAERLSRIEQMGEATALEVERIGEGQRFVTRILTERSERALPDGTILDRTV